MKIIIRTEILGQKAQATLEAVTEDLDKIEGKISFLNYIALSQFFFWRSGPSDQQTLLCDFPDASLFQGRRSILM